MRESRAYRSRDHLPTMPPSAAANLDAFGSFCERHRLPNDLARFLIRRAAQEPEAPEDYALRRAFVQWTGRGVEVALLEIGLLG
mgnify:CR=1 FL=1